VATRVKPFFGVKKWDVRSAKNEFGSGKGKLRVTTKLLSHTRNANQKVSITAHRSLPLKSPFFLGCRIWTPRVEANAEEIKKIKQAIIDLAGFVEAVAWRGCTSSEERKALNILDRIRARLDMKKTPLEALKEANKRNK